MRESDRDVKEKRSLPSEIVEATEDGGVCRLLALLAADHSALTTLLQVWPNFGARVILQERLPRLLQLLHLPPVFQDGAWDPVYEWERETLVINQQSFNKDLQMIITAGVNNSDLLLLASLSLVFSRADLKMPLGFTSSSSFSLSPLFFAISFCFFL